GSRLQIDDQFKFSRKLHRQVSRLGAFQYSVHVPGRALKQDAKVRAVDHQTAHTRVFSKWINGWNLAVCKSSNDFRPLAQQEKVRHDDASIRPCLLQSS